MKPSLLSIFLKYSATPLTLLFVGFLSPSTQSVAAQNLDARPVARLISSGPIYPVARRVESSVTNALPGPALDDANQVERRAFDETNRVRVANGFAPLQWDSELCRVARSHSENMATQGFFSHVTPDGKRLRDRAHSFGIDQFTVLGENIAYNLGYKDPGGFAVERWMASPDHRANILSAEFHTMAIGTYVGVDGSVFLTQIFITR